MGIKNSYEELAKAIRTTFNIEPVRTFPTNLRVELAPPAISIGFASVELASASLSLEGNVYGFAMAYLGNSEDGMLSAIEVMDDLICELPRETEFGVFTRILNPDGPKYLDYGFTVLIKIKETY